ncbi:MAG TPA: type I 3-dehydroquinate dehydratase [Candidatus Dormibacteraeota bacterium]|nr:type I 3-dehydroquinate dehydratase [Candidatus Dormibacteraeota bacterium]
MVEDDSNINTLMEEVSSKKPDLLEIRLDKLQEHRILEEIVARKSFPVIATDGSDRDLNSKLEQLAYAAGLGFDLVDLDLATADAAAVKHMKSKGARVILSFHDYSETPAQDRLTKILEAEKKLGCDICKIVTTARLPRDNLTILGFVQNEAARVRLVSFAMGMYGMPSRVLSPWFGAEFTFASLSDKSNTAEGQLTIDELRSAWQIFGLR